MRSVTRSFAGMGQVGISRLGLAFAVCLAAMTASSLAQTDETAGILTLEVENDLFGSGKDRHFTHGTRASWISGENQVPKIVREAASAFPLFEPEGKTRVAWSIGQNIFTPEDTGKKELIPDGRPYAGWLYAGATLVSDTGTRLDTIELNVGVVGPASLAEDVQTTWHEWIGSPRPEGWDNQLRNEPGVVLYYDRKWRALIKGTPLGYGFDVTPHIGGSIGNVLTHLGAGATARFGKNLPSDYGPPLIRPGIPGSSFFVPTETFGWYFFAGAAGRLVAHDIFLDGNTFRDSHSVDKKIAVGEIQAGIALTVRNVRIAYTHILRSREFENQNSADHFGAITVSVAF